MNNIIKLTQSYSKQTCIKRQFHKDIITKRYKNLQEILFDTLLYTYLPPLGLPGNAKNKLWYGNSNLLS